MNITLAIVNRNRTPAAAQFLLASAWILIFGMCSSGRALAQQPMLGADAPRISGPISVQTAVQIALTNNLQVLESEAGASAAMHETRIARSMTHLQVSTNTYLSIGNMMNSIGSSPNVAPFNSLSVPPNGFADQNLTLMAPIYTGGRLSNLVRAATGRERAAGAGIATARSDVALLVKDAYYRALFARELEKVADSRAAAAQSLVDNSRAMLQAGKGIQASVSRAESELADTRRMQTTASNDGAKTILDLKREMGINLDSPITLSDLLQFVAPTGDVRSSIQEAGRTRPELQAARAMVDVARAQVGVAKSSLQPQIYGAAMADLFAPGNNRRNSGATVGITISIPIIDSGQRSAEIGAAAAMKRRSEAGLKSAELQVGTEVRKAWLDIDTAAQNFRTAEAAVKSAQDAYEVVALRVQNQKAILVEQLDALAALTQSRTNLAQALYEHSIAVARLQRAIGRP